MRTVAYHDGGLPVFVVVYLESRFCALARATDCFRCHVVFLSNCLKIARELALEDAEYGDVEVGEELSQIRTG